MRLQIVSSEVMIADSEPLCLEFFSGPLDSTVAAIGVRALVERPLENSAGAPPAFEDRLGDVISWLASSDKELCMFLKGVSTEFFDELEAISSILVPGKHAYNLTAARTSRRDDVGDLLFVWPTDGVATLRDRWFVSPAVSVEGYIGARGLLRRLVALATKTDRTGPLSVVLREADVAFRLWQDYDGMSLFMQKDRFNDTRSRLQSVEFS